MLDNFATGRRENLAHLGDKIDLVEGDLRHHEEDLRHWCAGAEPGRLVSEARSDATDPAVATGEGP